MSTEKVLYKLPKGWILTTLGELCVINSGGTPDRRKPSFYKGSIPWVKSGELNFNIITETEEHISEIAIQNSSARVLPKDTLLVALYGATVGKLGILGIEAATNQAVAAIITSESILNRYLFFFLLHNKEKLLQQRQGGAQPNINQKILNDFIIPLPPLNEQKRIVSKIEELFSSLQESEISFNKVQKQLEIQKHLLLKNAFVGKLSKKWRRNNSPDSAAKLLKRFFYEREKQYYIQLKKWEKSDKEKKSEKPFLQKKTLPFTNQEVNELPKIPSTWKWAKLGDVGNLVSGQHILAKDYYKEPKGIPYLTGPSDFGDKFPIISKWTVAPKSLAKENDILITVKGSGVGKINIMNIEGAIGRQLMAFSTFSKEKSFLFFYLQSKLQSFQNLSTGTAIPGIDRESILNLACPILDEKEQTFIVQELDFQFSVIKNLEESISTSIKQLHILKHSIFKKAFSGQLVFQDSEDEDASIFLEKMKHEKDTYLSEQKIALKDKPKIIKFMENTKTIIEVLKEASNPLLSKDVWLNSIYEKDIDAFYAALKEHIEKGEVKEILPRKGKESLLSIN
ncbi:MAG TPA: restriction endonuclease subunit S [Ferruginibacter sp.]|nr:restriction endonuclease subunit S [Ferruginibacter sp.]